jgi:DNA-binding CsgD family transcriptional regulator
MGTAHGDGEWLELVADLLGQPLTRWPTERILSSLVTTFGAPAGSFHGQSPSGPLEGLQWPPDFYADRWDEVLRWTRDHAARDHPLLRYYVTTGRAEVMQVADVPDRIADRRVHDRWRGACTEVLDGSVVAQIALPVCLGPRTNRSFIVGRADPFSPGEVAQAERVHRVLVGLDRQIAAHARWSSRTGEQAIPAASAVGLTPRESAVLDLLASGGTARAIARRLAVGERTVQKHLQHVYTKLGVADRLAAVQRAQVLGLLPVPALRRP